MTSPTPLSPPLSAEETQGIFSTLDVADERPLRRPNHAPPSGLRAPSTHGKNFVLDTNVLIHDPQSIQRFGDNHVCIPVEVLSELDRFKNEQSDRGASARVVHRTLTKAFEQNPEAITTGVPTPEGGTLRLVVADPAQDGAQRRLARFHRVLPDQEQIDHRILACTLLISEENIAPTILVTKDLNMQLKGRTLGIQCEDYQNDKVNASDLRGGGIPGLEVSQSELQRFASSGSIRLEDGRVPELAPNDYVLLAVNGKRTIPARYHPSGDFVRLNLPDALKNPKGVRLKPMNLGQRCLLDALLNPEIAIVTCFGAAGTGKTLVAAAAGLHGIHERAYSGMTISRPVVPMGDSVGFLPGDLEEKMRPWLQPIYDALDYLMPPGNAKKQNGKSSPSSPPKSESPYQELIDARLIEIEALCFIRGRSIPNRFFILDEAQQMSPLEAKTVVTRMSKGAKLIMIGDPEQIDNPYVDSRSNGLVYTRRRLKNLPISAHVTLEKGERSDLAEAGAKLM